LEIQYWILAIYPVFMEQIPPISLPLPQERTFPFVVNGKGAFISTIPADHTLLLLPTSYRAG